MVKEYRSNSKQHTYMKTSKRILIIEDEKTLARALELKLTGSGFSVHVVYNGEDGVKLLRHEQFDLILLDLIMPEMDGFAVLATLKAEQIKIPVIVLTNLGKEIDVMRIKEFNVKDFFIKSNTPITIIAKRVFTILK